MQSENRRLNSTPLRVPRTTRTHDLRVLTSMPAGKMVPLAVIPMLREDAIQRGMARVSFEMMETAEVLMNAVNVTVKAYLVPFLAFERFLSLDELNRSYEAKAGAAGQVIPFFETMVAPAHGSNPILTYLGKHAKPGTTINTGYIETYNEIWNFRARNRSLNITPRARLATDLAPAFWAHNEFNHIVPDFDQAIADGEVALNVVQSKLPVKGIGLAGQINVSANNASVKESGTPGSSNVAYSTSYGIVSAGATVNSNQANLYVKSVATSYAPDIWAELQANGITVSLSNIEMARKTQAFAAMRRQFHGHSDEWLIDLLMDAIGIPEQAWKHPILLADESTIFGMSKRYASDAANLTESVVNGMTSIDLSFRVPQLNPGGIVMIVAEVTPEQLFERRMDYFLHSSQVAHLPQYLRDELDPEKVSIVPNKYVDVDHATPDATFGYAPLNHEWAGNPPQIGGRFYRPAVNSAFDEARQRIWAVETASPVLGPDFYLCTTMHTKPFIVTNQDPFEATVRGAAVITGNTVFGPALMEANNDYQEVLEEAPQARIQGVNSAATP